MALDEGTIKTGDYGKFTEAMSKVDKLNASLSDKKTEMQGLLNNLNDESIFAGPICEACVQEFTVVNTLLTDLVTNFTTIQSYLSKSLTNYQNADQSAISYLSIKDNKVIETAAETPISTSIGNNQALADSLAAEIGKRSGDYSDSPTKFHDGEWCADFVSYMLRKNGYNVKWSSVAGDTGNSAIFESLRNEGAKVHYGEFATKHGKTPDTSYVAQGGDVVLLNVDDDSGVDHVGFVVKDNGNGTITTIEGNTFKNGESYDGHGVVEQHIRQKSDVYGYATPVKSS